MHQAKSASLSLAATTKTTTTGTTTIVFNWYFYCFWGLQILLFHALCVTKDVAGFSGIQPTTTSTAPRRYRSIHSTHCNYYYEYYYHYSLKMTADTTAEEEAAAAENSTTDETTTSTTTTTTTTTTPPIVSVSNRLFLSHIDYTNHDGEENGKNKKNTNSNVNANANSSCEEDLTTLELSPQTVKQRLEELFSKFGSVQEIYLSDKDKTKTKSKSKSKTKSVGENQKHDQKHEQERPPFAFIAMETAEEARAALNGLGLVTTGGGGQTQTQAASESARRLFRDLAPAKVHKSKKNKQNKSDRLRSERLQEYRQRLALVVAVAAAAAKDGSGTGTSTDTGKANATATAKPVANVVCQVHTSHLDRLRDFASEQEGVDLVGSYSAQKGTSFVMLRASDNDNDNHNDNDGDDAPERLSRKLWDTWYVAPNLNRVTVLDHYSDSTTSANNNNNTGTSSTSTPVVVEGNLRNGVVPAIVKSLSQLGTGTRTRTGTTKDAVRLRLAVYPPKLQRTLLDALDNYTRTRTREAAKAKQDGNGKQHQHQHHPEIELSPGNPTHTISIIQLHPGVVVTPKSKGDNDKALYVLGRLESVPPTRKRSLDNDDDNEDDGNDDNSNSNSNINNNININNNKYQLQQQSTSLVPQPKRRYKNKDPVIPSATGTLPLRPLAAGDPTNDDDDDDNDENEADNNDNDNDKSISRAYWKLQEAWERYEHGAPCLDRARARGSDSKNNNNDDNDDDDTTKMMWALDCGAAPGGWTKFLFRPGVVERIYAVDPGELSPDVVPGLDDRLRRARNNNDNNDSPSPPPVVRHVVSTIQAALPSLVSDLAAATAIETETETATETPPTTSASASATTTTTTTTTTTKRVLDVWVSDMCVKDVRGQIDALLAARDACVVGPGTFFVLTLKCVVGYSAKAFEYQTNEQVARLSGISRDVQVVHLFSNRSSERTVIGYLI